MSNFIQKFVQETGLKFESRGEIGFGHACVGIVNEATETYLAYEAEDRSGRIEHEVASRTKPDTAYGSGPYVAVLYDGSEAGRLGAIEELNQWIGRILVANYEIKTFKETNSVAALIAGGSVQQKCLGGGVNFSRFMELL